MELKLAIELVPQPLWRINPRLMMGPSKWKKLREKVYAEYEYRCGICEYEGRLETHEIWEYDDKRSIQKLRGFIALCHYCHAVKHLGAAGIRAAQGQEDIDKIIEHFVTVNGCTTPEYEEHRAHAMQLWKRRSTQKNWSVDWGQYQEYFKNNPNTS